MTLQTFHFYLFQTDRVIFCLFLPVDVDVYSQLMQSYFPVTNDESEENGDEAKTKPKQDTKGRISVFILAHFIYVAH